MMEIRDIVLDYFGNTADARGISDIVFNSSGISVRCEGFGVYSVYGYTGNYLFTTNSEDDALRILGL